MSTPLSINAQLLADAAEILNRHCQQTTLDATILHQEIFGSVKDGCITAHKALPPHLFSSVPVFIAPHGIANMQQLVAAVENVVKLPMYRNHVMQWAPSIAKFSAGPQGVFLGYDFHFANGQVQLIEINTNAGGGMINSVLVHAQQRCCGRIVPDLEQSTHEDKFISMFRREWNLQRGENNPLERIAIVDTHPQAQYLYVEFLLFQRLFQCHGIEAVIVDPSQLIRKQNALWYDDRRIDLIYNRLTDFAFDMPPHKVLRDAYLSGEVVVTPHPHAHALYADKRNLTVLGDKDLLTAWGVATKTIEILCDGIPQTVLVTEQNADHLWKERRSWFFKPVAGYGSKAVYRGDKITRGVYNQIRRGDYVAQHIVPANERIICIDKTPSKFKLDWRQYVYDSETLLLAARLYQGQTTNFRTAGGGFAPVFSLDANALDVTSNHNATCNVCD